MATSTVSSTSTDTMATSSVSNASSAPNDTMTYQSVFTTRYGSKTLREIWSDHNKRVYMRKVWAALAMAQHVHASPECHVSKDQYEDLAKHIQDIDIPRALEIEQDVRHDVVAEIHTYAEQCPVGGSIIHQGATSEDINDNVYALRINESLTHLKAQLIQVISALVVQIHKYVKTPCLAYTHIQAAAPTTIGGRLAVYLQDLSDLYSEFFVFKGKGFKGAVGTQATYGPKAQQMEAYACKLLNLTMPNLDKTPAIFNISTQTSTRTQDLKLLNLLTSLGAVCHKLALDVRILSSTGFQEWQEAFGQHQVGSSAMPWKRNPITSENIDSLTRMLVGHYMTAFQNASQAVLERSLDDSANRRVYIPESLLIMDEVLNRVQKLISGLVINVDQIQKNLQQQLPYAVTEKLLSTLVSKGHNRQECHEHIRQICVNNSPTTAYTVMIQEFVETKQWLTQSEFDTIMDTFVQESLGTVVSRVMDLISNTTVFYDLDSQGYPEK